MKVIFNRKFHLGKWYEAGEVTDIRERAAKRFIHRGVMHPAPKKAYKKKKENKVEGSTKQKKGSAWSKVQKRTGSGYSVQGSKTLGK